MIRRPPRSTQSRSSAASDVYKRQGQNEFKLGTYFPEFKLNNREVKQWQERSVLTIPECQDCEVSLICGGGCGAVAKDRLGKILAPDCHPIKELLTIGLNYYGDDLLKMGH